MTAKTKKIIGLSVALVWVILELVLVFVRPWVALFALASFAFGAVALYLYENGKLKEAVEAAQIAAQEATAKRKTKKETKPAESAE